MECPKCLASNEASQQCWKCGIYFTKVKGGRTIQLPVPDTANSTNSEALDRFSFTSPVINSVALPLVFILATLINLVPFFHYIVSFNFGTPIHEFGHAVNCWMGNIFALPLFLPGTGLTIPIGGKSPIVFFLFAVLNLKFLSYLVLNRFLVWAILPALMLVGQVVCTLVISQADLLFFITFGGCGAELYLSTLFVILFYHPAPDRIRWDFFRFIFLVVGAFCFVSAFQLWFRAKHNVYFIPWGSGVTSDRDAASGDMQSLVAGGWSAFKIASVYFRTATYCAAVIVGHYFYFLFRRV